MLKRAFAVLVLAISFGRVSFAIGPNDYNEGMVTLEHSYAACVGNSYRHDLHWQTLPTVCCGWNRVKNHLLRRSYPSSLSYSHYLSGPNSPPFPGLSAPQCVLVPHNYAYKMELEAFEMPPDVISFPWIFFVSHETIIVPVRCTTSQ